MKKIFLLTSIVLASISCYAKDIRELVVTTIPPMSCQNCENKIKGNLRFEKGVTKIETNIPDQRVTIEYDADKTTPEKIEKGFQKIGYKVEVINETESNDNADNNTSQVSQTTTCTGGCCSNPKE